MGSLGSVPPLRQYYGQLRLLMIRPAPLRFLRVAVSPSVGLVRSRSSPTRRRAWTCSAGCPSRVFGEDHEVSQVSGCPHACAPRSLTPARPRSLALTRSLMSPSPFCIVDRSRKIPSFRGSITRLHAPCVRFAAGVTAVDATLGTGWVATPCRTGPSPAGARTRFQLISFASSSASFIWRKPGGPGTHAPGLPQIRTCGSPASGSSIVSFATDGRRCARRAELEVGSVSRGDETAPKSYARGWSGGQATFSTCASLRTGSVRVLDCFP